jgi:hypothetical protein
VFAGGMEHFPAFSECSSWARAGSEMTVAMRNPFHMSAELAVEHDRSDVEGGSG